MKQIIKIISEELNNKDGLLFLKILAMILLPATMIMAGGVIVSYLSNIFHN